MIRTEYNHDLTAQNTFRMRVSCACFMEYDSPGDLDSLEFDKLPQPVISIGGGSNILFTKDFPGTILHSRIDTVKFVDMGLDEAFMIVGAGVSLDSFVRKACEAPYWGAENLSLIPGDVGAAAVQNVGAYGSEIKDIIAGVVCYDTALGKKVSFKVKECRYGYRDSIFKDPGHKGRYIITSVLFRLSRKYRPNLCYKALKDKFALKSPDNPSEVRDAVISIRRGKLPDPSETGSAGSYFKNPVVTASVFAQTCPEAPFYDLGGGMVKIPAAWLIEKSGLKGAVQGGAAVYDRQPLVIVNRTSTATPEDVLELEHRITRTVREKFGIELVPEVEHI